MTNDNSPEARCARLARELCAATDAEARAAAELAEQQAVNLSLRKTIAKMAAEIAALQDKNSKTTTAFLEKSKAVDLLRAELEDLEDLEDDRDSEAWKGK
jgi:hypothetical protein